MMGKRKTFFVPVLVLLSCLLFGQDQALKNPERIVRATRAPADAVWLDEMDLQWVDQEWGVASKGKTVQGNPLLLRGQRFIHGIGSHANSEMWIDLKRNCTRFVAMVGVDDEVKQRGSVVFQVWIDEKLSALTPVLRGGDKPYLLDVDVSGGRQMELLIDNGNGSNTADHADWAGALLFLQEGAGEKPETFDAVEESVPEISFYRPPQPQILSPRIVGTTPGRPFLFLIPASGEGPLQYQAEDLPPDLLLDEKTGIIIGVVNQRGTHRVKISVTGKRGTANGVLTIEAGPQRLALTPPMGWSSRSVWGTAVADRSIREAADWLVKSGLAAYGYQYINIDDAWAGGRDQNGGIRTNKKFPNMKALSEYLHERGLKLGLCSSPGPKTCAGYEGSYLHEQEDARTFAAWGVDYLKYDWCSYGDIVRSQEVAELRKPYRLMRQALSNCQRDIVFSICQYGRGAVWEWGAAVGGNLWRTTGNINDTWASIRGIGFRQNGLEKYASAGHWNDLDMLMVGKVGRGRQNHATRLKRNEQMTQVSLWCILTAPLLLGCDLTQLDPFTLALLTNEEVVAIDQDLLGKQGYRVRQIGKKEVWAKELWDGTFAVGLFNLLPRKSNVIMSFADIGLTGKQPVRNLWLKKDLGEFSDFFAADVPAHGVVLVKIGAPKETLTAE